MAKRRQTTGQPKKKKAEAPEETTQTSGVSATVGNIVRRAQGQEPNREYRSRAEQEADIQRLVILATTVAIGLIVVILGLAFIVDGIIRPQQPVATINDTTINVAQFEQRVRLERAVLIEQINDGIANFVQFTGSTVNDAANQVISQPPFSTYYSDLTIPDQMGIRVLDEMIDEELVRQEADRLGITVTNEEIDQEINEFIGYDPERVAAIGVDPTSTPTPTIAPTALVSPTPSPEPTATPIPTEETPAEATDEDGDAVEATATITPAPTATAEPTLNATEVTENFVDRREQFLDSLQSASGMSDEQIRGYFEYRVLRRKVAEAQLEDPSQFTFVNARHILVATEDEANDIIAALNAGEPFSDLASARSTDTGSATNGGELGWQPAFQYVPPFAEATLTGEIGATLGPIESDFGFHVIQVSGREIRDITEAQTDRLIETTIVQWIEDARESEENVIETFPAFADNIPSSPPFVLRDNL